MAKGELNIVETCVIFCIELIFINFVWNIFFTTRLSLPILYQTDFNIPNITNKIEDITKTPSHSFSETSRNIGIPKIKSNKPTIQKSIFEACFFHSFLGF